MAPNFVPPGHDATDRKKVFLINRMKLRIIWGHVFLPKFYKWQRRSHLIFLQQAVNKACHFSERVVSVICCRGRVHKFVGNWNKNIYHTHGNRTTITHVLLWRVKINEKEMCNYRGTILVRSLKVTCNISWTNTFRRSWKVKDDGLDILTDFEKETQQTKFHSRHLVQLEVSVYPFFVNITKTIYMVTKMH